MVEERREGEVGRCVLFISKLEKMELTHFFRTVSIEAVGIGLKTIQEKRQNVQDLSKEGEEKDTF